MSDSNIAVNVTTCLACGNCVDRCIMDNLRLSLPPCRQADPLGINYQGVLRLVAQGREEDAARELRRFTAFGGMLAFSASDAGERACSRKRMGNEGLDLRGILRYLAEHQGDIVYAAPRRPANGKKAAVIGSGPAGLQAAHDLRSAGYAVDLYASEAETAALAQCVPVSVLDRTMGMLSGMGVSMMQASSRGSETACDAVLFCDGTHSDRADRNGWVEEKLFAARIDQDGADMAKGMASGAALAHTVRNFLEGFALDYESDRRAAQGLERFRGINEEDVSPAARVLPSGEVFTQAEARQEAARCLGCGRPFEENQTCWYCLPCEVVCPTQALHVRIPYLIR